MMTKTMRVKQLIGLVVAVMLLWIGCVVYVNMPHKKPVDKNPTKYLDAKKLEEDYMNRLLFSSGETVVSSSSGAVGSVYTTGSHLLYANTAVNSWRPATVGCNDGQLPADGLAAGQIYYWDGKKFLSIQSSAHEWVK